MQTLRIGIRTVQVETVCWLRDFVLGDDTNPKLRLEICTAGGTFACDPEEGKRLKEIFETNLLLERGEPIGEMSHALTLALLATTREKLTRCEQGNELLARKLDERVATIRELEDAKGLLQESLLDWKKTSGTLALQIMEKDNELANLRNLIATLGGTRE